MGGICGKYNSLNKQDKGLGIGKGRGGVLVEHTACFNVLIKTGCPRMQNYDKRVMIEQYYDSKRCIPLFSDSLKILFHFSVDKFFRCNQ